MLSLLVSLFRLFHSSVVLSFMPNWISINRVRLIWFSLISIQLLIHLQAKTITRMWFEKGPAYCENQPVNSIVVVWT